jgi:hypothetical protein
MKRLGDLWCVLMHSELMWPMHGEYECRNCGRRYPVLWAGEPHPAHGVARPGSVFGARLLARASR